MKRKLLRLTLLFALVFIIFRPCVVHSQAKSNPGIYILTDKTHYLAGERIWVGAFLFDTAGFRLLRKTHPLYLQLYAPDGRRVSDEILYTQNGRGFGYLELDAAWAGGLYRLRACTREYNAAGPAFERLVSLRRYDENWLALLPPPPPIVAAPGLKIAVQMDKAAYGLREKVTLKIRVLDAATRRPVRGAFALLVSDTAVFQANGLGIIHAIGKPSKALELPENGEALCVDGRIVNRKTKEPVEHAELVMMVHDSLRKFSRMTKTDAKGYFRFANLPLEGRPDITFQISNWKGKPLGNAIVEWTPFPPPEKLPPLESEKRALPRADLEAALFGLRQPDGEAFDYFQGAVMLDEITVADKKTPRPDFVPPPGVTRLHSRPNFAFDFDENSPRFSRVRDMIAMLPGVIILQHSDEDIPGDSPCNFAVRTRGFNHAAPMYLVDGLEVDHRYLCESLNPAEIIRIEMLDGANAGVYGQGAGGGVIAFYQRGRMNETGKSGALRDVQNSHLRGYQPDKPFYMPDYSDPVLKSGTHTDRRHTLCWMPEIVTDESGFAEAHFYTGDLPGQYRVVVEGMTHGAAGRGENVLKVER